MKIKSSRLIFGLLSFTATSLTVNAAPQNGQVVGGQGSISQSGANTTVQQNTNAMVVEWQNFNINTNETVTFNQPSSQSTVLNNILDSNPSEIFGSINANDNVFLANPNGLIFGVDSVVNVNSLIASGLSIGADDFMQGNYLLSQNSQPGSVVNYGLIQAATGGNVALVGGEVAN